MIQEIKTVTTFSTEGSDWIVNCPHCGRVTTLERGPIRGEQFFDKACRSWFEVSFDARIVSTLEDKS